MAKPRRNLTAFGKDLDALLEQAGKLSIREYADHVSTSMSCSCGRWLVASPVNCTSTS